jgi:cyanophycinase
MSKGILLLIGGGEDTTEDMLVLQELVKISGGNTARIGVVTTASMHEREIISKYRNAFTKMGLGDVFHFDIRKQEEADTEINLTALDNTDAIIFSGGSQVRLTTILGGTEFIKKVMKRYEEGMVVAGTSAGAAAMSNPIIHEGASEDAFLYGEVKVSLGFGFLKDAVVDTHVDTRFRIGRLLQILAINKNLLCIGVGEDTGLVINPDGSSYVIGSSTVLVLDGREIKYTNTQEIEYGEAIAIGSVRLDVLASGCQYNINERRIESLKKKGNKFLFFR